MNAQVFEDHVFPRPVSILPEYADARARKNLSERLVDAFRLSQSASNAIANAVVDPAAVRKSIGDPVDPECEKIAVPGGILLGIRTETWARRITPDPRNPRTLPSRRHPFAIEPGTGGEDSKFRPIPEPSSPEGQSPQIAELTVPIESREHLTWAAQQAAAFVLAENNWAASISSQGVMEAVWLVATTYLHKDGCEPVSTLTTAEGSSRVTAVHSLLGIRSADVCYDDSDSKLRAHIRRLNEAYERGSRDELIALRCERVPALILVGFVPHPQSNVDLQLVGFPTAIKSMVALRHVDPPKPWGEGPENESLADEVLDEMYRRDLISKTEREYYAGSCTRHEAKAAHLPDDPAIRAAMIVRLFSNTDERVVEAIRVAVTSQSTRKRITTKLANELATALILRAIAEDPDKTDQIRRYLRHAFGKSVHKGSWKISGRSTSQIVKEAVDEIRTWIAGGMADEPGPVSLELIVRAAYPLIVSGRLNADRGSSSNLQPDRRTPGEVLDAMRRSIGGVHQLGQVLIDFLDGPNIRAVDENGAVKKSADGQGEQMINDIYLRNEFPPAGRSRAKRPGDTPAEHFENRLGEFSTAAASLERAFEAISTVLGDDGRPLVDSIGVSPSDCSAWRDMLGKIDEELIIWARVYRKKFGGNKDPQQIAPEDRDPYDLDSEDEVGPDEEGSE